MIFLRGLVRGVFQRFNASRAHVACINVATGLCQPGQVLYRSIGARPTASLLFNPSVTVGYVDLLKMDTVATH